MRIELVGKINRTYVQSLCMMFFHGEKFPQDSEGEEKSLIVEAIDTEKGIACKCKLTAYGKTVDSESFAPFGDDEKYERTSKTAVGNAVFKAFSQLTGKSVPWGILTGIRPSKVAAELIKLTNEKKAIDILKERYLLSENKASLAVEVAKNECEILSMSEENTCSVYISIPFCPSRCTYCSFISYATPKLFSLIPEYVLRLTNDIKRTFDEINEKKLNVLSIYIGGGTPTVLSAEQLVAILSTIAKCTDVSKLKEFTLEGGRPDTITEEKLKIAKKYGITRFSVNPQSLNDNVLLSIGRKHTVEDFLNAYKLVKDSKIGFINTDLIAGLDSDTFETFKATIDKIIELSPDNVTVHSFSVKKSAQILRDNQDIYDKTNDDAIKSVDYAYKMLTQNGYIPYYMYRQKNTICDLENVGYAKKDTFGIYNVLMMSDCHTVYGIGAGATTKLVSYNDGILEINRIFSPKYPYEYLQDKQ